MQRRNSYLIGKAFKSYIVASVLTVASTQVANIVDAAIVGNLIGPEALASVNLCKPVLQAFFSFSCLYVASATMMAGVAIGQGDKRKADKLFSFAVVTSLLLGIVLMVLGIAAFNPLSQLLCNSESLRQMTNDFLLVSILSAAPQLLMLALNQFLAVDGAPKLVTRNVFVGNVINILFDIVFIKVFGWGISGAAWATFVMYLVCIVMVIPHFRQKDSLHLCRVKRGDINYRNLLTIGIPVFFSTVLLSVQLIGSNYVASTYLGEGGLVALAVCVQLVSFSMIILSGSLRTIQPIGAILKGLGDDRGMSLLLKRTYTFLGICLALYAAVIVAFPAPIARILGAANESSMPFVLEALPLFSLNIVMQVLLYNLMPVYQFYGHNRLALFLSIAQTIFPMIGFWILRGGWIGFFLGQAIVAIVLLVFTSVVRSKDKNLAPLTLIPRSDVKKVFDVTMETSAGALKDCLTGLYQFLCSQSQPQIDRMMLCAEELLNNIVNHGQAKYVDVRATENCISIHDDGKPFNPLDMESLRATSLQNEGIGLRIVQGINLDIKYDYRFNQNMVTIKPL